MMGSSKFSFNPVKKKLKIFKNLLDESVKDGHGSVCLHYTSAERRSPARRACPTQQTIIRRCRQYPASQFPEARITHIQQDAG
jgi:hypothetical protein